MLANAASGPTFNGMWVYEYDVEAAQQSRKWRDKSEPGPKKPHQSHLKNKAMFIVFFD